MAQDILRENSVKKLIIKKEMIADDFFDDYGIRGTTQNLQVELSIKSKGGYLRLNRLPQFLENPNNGLIEVHNLEGIGINNDEGEVQLVTRINNSDKIMNVNNLESFRPSFDIHDQMDLPQNSNVPEFNRIVQVARQELNDLLASANIQYDF